MFYLVRDHLFPVLVFLHALLAGAPPHNAHGRFNRLGRRYTVKRLARLPAPIAESSGLARGDSAGLVWTHGDGGTAATLYLAGLDGRLRNAVPLAPLTNNDWEDAASILVTLAITATTGATWPSTALRWAWVRPASIPLPFATPTKRPFRPH
jgi:hypothetical protein